MGIWYRSRSLLAGSSRLFSRPSYSNRPCRNFACAVRRRNPGGLLRLARIYSPQDYPERQIRFYTIQTVFAGARLLGAGIAASYLAQIVAAAIAATMVVRIWRRDIRFELKAAALVAAIALASPYMIYYDLVVLGLPIASLALEGRRQDFFRLKNSFWLSRRCFPLICGPVASRAHVPLTPFVCFLLLALIIRRSKMAVRAPVRSS